MAFDRVPVILEPPHDPTSVLLDGRTGWHMASSTDVEADGHGALRLMPLLDSLPSMANPAGTFGNLVPPANTAMTPEGTILLVDRASKGLLRFDPCECAFQPVPCFGGPAGSPRQVDDPQGIGVSRGWLFVCDPARQRVLRFTLNGLALGSDLGPPLSAHPTWEPWAIAFDRGGRAFVTDRAGGQVHRFDRRGRWEKALVGFASPTWITVDLCGRLLVSVTGASGPELRVTDPDGIEVSLEPRSDLLVGCFAPLPFAVDTDGNLDLGPLCRETGRGCDEGSGWFDPNGEPIDEEPPHLPVSYSSGGEMIIGPLDSRIEGCVWHRLTLHGAIPEGTQLRFETFTAEEPYTADQLAGFARWTDGFGLDLADREALLRSAGGRYLWLKLVLGSSGPTTPSITAVEIEFPRLGPRRYLPAVFGAEPVSADFTDRFLAIFDTTLRGIERAIDTQARLFDPLSAPADRVGGAGTDFLSWLASWVGVSLDRRWSESRRRRLLKSAGSLFDSRGTLGGLRAQLDLLLGLDAYDQGCPRGPEPTRCGEQAANCTPLPPCEPWTRPPLVLEHFRLRRWLWLGAGRLGSEAMLWGNRIVNRSSLDANARVGESILDTTQDPLRDPYHVYAHKFTVFVPCRYRESDKGRRALETMLKNESPAHTRHQVTFVEPRFRIGVQSMIGFDAVVGGVPAGVRLGETRLDGGKVLTSKVDGGAAPYAVGRQGRMGTSARIG